MTGRINYTPEAQQQLNELDDWITKSASAEIARFVWAILEHIVLSPSAGLRQRPPDLASEGRVRVLERPPVGA